jgi:putative ABC transport system ATP-binding protein
MERLNDEFEKTIIMVTHDPRAADHAHRFLHLDKGRLWVDRTEAAGSDGSEGDGAGSRR